MLSLTLLIADTIRKQAERHGEVMPQLEDVFGLYETGRLSIIGYLEAVTEMSLAFRGRRATWLWLCDCSVVLRWANRAERRAFREACEALDWCRNWALRQRGVDVLTCLEHAGATQAFAPGALAGAAA